MTMISFLLFLLFHQIIVEAGNVGKCRTECIERNVAKIVRVHLKDQLVMIGLCTNNTKPNSMGVATVTPFVCHRNVGVWTFDDLDLEGIVQFKKICPTPEKYSYAERLTCSV